MQIVSSSDARNHLSAYLDAAQREAVVIQKQGRNAAVLMSYDDFQRLTQSSTHQFQDICARISGKARMRGLTDDMVDAILSEE